MMQRLLLALLTLLPLTALAQPYGNEWIDHGRPHYAFSVDQEGIHRIPASVLSSAGLTGVAPERFVLFRDGRQVPIRVVTSGSGVTAIEFFGEPRDGGPDSLLYATGRHQPNEHFSLFQDEAVYYLSHSTAPGHARLTTVANDLTALPPPEATVRATAFVQFIGDFQRGEPAYIGGSSLPQAVFAEGEGYIGTNAQRFQNSTPTRTVTLPTPGAAAGGANAELTVSVVSTSVAAHDISVAVGPTTVFDTIFNNYAVVKPTVPVPASSVAPGATTVTFTASPTATGTNRNTISFVQLDYDRDLDMDGATSARFGLPPSAGRQYLEIEDLDDLGTRPVLYDLTNGLRIVSTDAPGSAVHRFALPPSTTERDILVRANTSATLTEVASMEQKAFRDFASLVNQGDYILLSNEDFIGTPELQAYRDHRNVPAGDFDVVVVDVAELYDQFAFGIEKHPIAIRHFTSFVLDTWSIQPKALFIVGKARPYTAIRFGNGFSCRVPTWGDVGSDVLLTASRTSSVPRIPIGRLAVTDAAQISTYLDKVVDYEAEQAQVGDPYQTLANKEWMKQVIHFGGGTTSSEQAVFRSYLRNYENVIEDTLYGANVFSWFKTSSDPIQVVQSDLISQKITDGVSLITFFGHSYAGGFDISFDRPDQYDNPGKYPVIVANGCNAGLIHGSNTSISEDFVFAPNRGAIAYLSTTDFSVSSALNVYSQRLYRALSRTDYLNGLGDITQRTVEAVEACCASSVLDMLVAHTMTLHGDPAVAFNQYPETDYAIEPSSVLFDDDVTIAQDSFDLDLIVTNLGEARRDSISIEVVRILPDGSQVERLRRVAGIPYKDTLTFTFSTVTEDFAGTGLNDFNIRVDVFDDVPNELSETNNDLVNGEVTLFIGSDDVYPIHPYEFAIVPDQAVTLKASTGDPFAPVRRYVFEIDTSELFTSPLETGSQTIGGGVVRWTPSLLFEDSTVYYWRVSKDSVYDGSYTWGTSSFIYLEDEFPGWNQSHYYQWLKDDYANVVLESDRDFAFVDDQKEVIVRTGLFNGFGGQLDFEEMEWYLNGAEINSWSMNACGFNRGLSIAIIDGNSGLPKDVVNTSGTDWGPYGNYHCAFKPSVLQTANFKITGSVPPSNPMAPATWSDVVVDYLDTRADPGDYILVYSINNPGFDLMSPALVSTMNGLGALGFNTGLTGPYAFFARKGDPSYTPQEIITSSFSTDVAQDTFFFAGAWDEGRITSTVIGPASDWGSFHWRWNSLDASPADDDQQVVLSGLTSAGTPTDLATVTAAQDTLLNWIDADQYPYLRLRLETSDDANRTPTQLDYWRVLYDKAPEAAINPNAHFALDDDTVQLGGEVRISVGVENVSEVDMDSLWGRYAHRDGQNATDVSTTLHRPLPAFDTLHMRFDRPIDEQRFTGSNALVLEANPLGPTHQIEQFHFNNIAVVDFDVAGDRTNPLLDVTFDGRHILDGEIVSPTPRIEVMLKDENRFLALDDTSLVRIWFRHTETGEMWSMPFSHPDVEFFPADAASLSERNEARIRMQPEFTENGIYELIVRGRDVSGNASSSTGDRVIGQERYDYKVGFEVVRESMITNVLNYPNPFTTQTRFVFTLTGTDIPDRFRIRIFNVRGTVVKEIDQTELGPIRIGLNVTDYAWDGTDEWGDELANGVYFYQVTTSLDGEDVDHLEIDQVDRFFERGLGKMVLIR